MAKVSNARRLKSTCQICKRNPCQFRFCSRKAMKHVNKEKHCITSEKKDWEAAACAVCMEFPHNAVLLLCSSHNKGCRPYMCATGHRFSNCLDQYRKAYTKVTCVDGTEPVGTSEDALGLGSSSFSYCDEKMRVSELLCPLCRGQVKGWTVVELARKYLDKKKRVCLQDNCSFVGNYKQLRKHVKAVHPFSRPREVDPVKEQKWKLLEGERARRDAISTVTSSMPGAMIVGDYIIETNFDDFFSGSDSDDSDAYSDDDDDNPFQSGRLGSWSGGPHLNDTVRRGFHVHQDGSGVRRWADLSGVLNRDGFHVVRRGGAPPGRRSIGMGRMVSRRRSIGIS